MTILKVTYGNPVASIKGICEHYQISDRTARMIVKELEQERGRYGDYTVLGDGALKRVNFLAFTDYWQFRKMLQDKNARKHVPVYSPQKVARSLGFYGGEMTAQEIRAKIERITAAVGQKGVKNGSKKNVQY